MHQYSIVRAAVAVGTTPKTVLLWATPSTRKTKLLEIGIGFNSVDATHGPALVELVRYTNSGTGTSLTPAGLGFNEPAALSSAKHTLTVEPTGPTVLFHWDVAVQSGQWSPPFPFGDEVGMAVSDFMGIRVTTPQTQSCDPYMKMQE